MPLTTRDTLLDVRELLSDPAHWTQAAAARTASGQPTSPMDPAARSWCLIGALRVVAADGGRGPASSTLRMLLPEFNDTLSYFNDNADHAEVLDLIDRAIKTCL